MSAIRLITDQTTIYFPDPTNNYLIAQDKAFLFFRPKGKFLLLGFFQHVLSDDTNMPPLVQEAINNDIGIVYVCDKLPDNKIVHPNIVYVKVQWAWLIHTLFFNPLLFRGVFGNSKMQRTVKAFSCFTKYNIPVVNKLSGVRDMSTQYTEASSNLLFEIAGGIGDHLLCTPTLKTLHSQGKKISVLIDKHRKVCLDNLDYIENFYHRKQEINVDKFDGIHWLNFGQVLNDYKRELNQQNRIYSVANLCGLGIDELVRDVPEIVLTEEEKAHGKELVKDYKNTIFFGFDSARCDSRIPLPLAQQVIDKLNSMGFTVITSALKKQKIANCIDLTGALKERDLFSLIYSVDKVLTIDTAFLHIAGAFNKELYALVNYFEPEWRTSTYKNCKSYTPNISCYPCASGWYQPHNRRQCNFGRTCYSTFKWDRIYKDIKNG
jgi:ADP-heptose:LPS heptosyltransferase